MTLLQHADAAAVFPEIVLAILAMALLMFGVFRREDTAEKAANAAVLALAIVATLVLWSGT